MQFIVSPSLKRGVLPSCSPVSNCVWFAPRFAPNWRCRQPLLSNLKRSSFQFPFEQISRAEILKISLGRYDHCSAVLGSAASGRSFPPLLMQNLPWAKLGAKVFKKHVHYADDHVGASYSDPTVALCHSRLSVHLFVCYWLNWYAPHELIRLKLSWQHREPFGNAYFWNGPDGVRYGWVTGQ